MVPRRSFPGFVLVGAALAATMTAGPVQAAPIDELNAVIAATRAAIATGVDFTEEFTISAGDRSWSGRGAYPSGVAFPHGKLIRVHLTTDGPGRYYESIRVKGGRLIAAHGVTTARRGGTWATTSMFYEVPRGAEGMSARTAITNVPGRVAREDILYGYYRNDSPGVPGGYYFPAHQAAEEMILPVDSRKGPGDDLSPYISDLVVTPGADGGETITYAMNLNGELDVPQCSYMNVELTVDAARRVTEQRYTADCPRTVGIYDEATPAFIKTATVSVIGYGTPFADIQRATRPRVRYARL